MLVYAAQWSKPAKMENSFSLRKSQSSCDRVLYRSGAELTELIVHGLRASTERGRCRNNRTGEAH